MDECFEHGWTAPSSGVLCSLSSASWTLRFGKDHWAQGSRQIPVQLLACTSNSKGELQNMKPYWIQGMSYALYIPYPQLGSNHCSPHNHRGRKRYFCLKGHVVFVPVNYSRVKLWRKVGVFQTRSVHYALFYTVLVTKTQRVVEGQDCDSEFHY